MACSRVYFTFTLGFVTETIQATESQIFLVCHTLASPDLAYFLSHGYSRSHRSSSLGRSNNPWQQRERPGMAHLGLGKCVPKMVPACSVRGGCNYDYGAVYTTWPQIYPSWFLLVPVSGSVTITDYYCRDVDSMDGTQRRYCNISLIQRACATWIVGLPFSEWVVADASRN